MMNRHATRCRSETGVSDSETTLEGQVATLEKQVAELMQHVLKPPVEKDWRSTIGMFAGDPVMREIQEEGRKIREADREQVV